MALPNIMKRLFRNDGYGPLLKPEIIPFTSDLASKDADVAASTKWVNDWYDGLVIPHDLYVDAVNGNDANSGFSAAEAVKTIDRIETIMSSPTALKPQTITIHVAAGTYGGSGTTLTGVPGLELYYYFASGARVYAISVSGNKTVNLCGTLTIFGNKLFAANGATLVLGSSGSGFDLTFDNLKIDTSIQAQSNATIRSQWGGTSCKIHYKGACTFSNATVVVDCTGYIDCSLKGSNKIQWIVDSGGSVTSPSNIRYRLNPLSALLSVGGPNVIPGTGTGGFVDNRSYFS